MRSDLDDNKGRKLDITQVRWGVERKKLTGHYSIPSDSPILQFLDPDGGDRDVTLPALKRGACYAIVNIGSANTLTVKTPAAVALTTLSNVQGCLFVCSGLEWKFFANTLGDALDPTEVSSPDGSITVTIVGGTNITVVVNEANVDHDALLNFVANEHIDHSTVSILTAANSGLAGGGTIAASRSLSIDINNLTLDTPVLGDSFAFFDLSGGDTNKATLTTLNGILVHDNLSGFSANRHIDHSVVSVTAGAGLTGGGTIDATRTVSLDITGQSDAALVGADEFIYWDVSGSDFDKRTFTNMISDLTLLTVAAGNAAYQPLDSDLTAIAALTTTANGRSLLATADAAAIRTIADAQQLNTRLTQLATGISDPNEDRLLFWDDSAGNYALIDFDEGAEFFISGTTGKIKRSFTIALSDETTAITTGTNKATVSFPRAITVTSVYASVNTVSSSGIPTVDINEAGTTILGNKLTIDAGEKTSATAATAATITDASIAANAEIGFDIDVAGTGAKGLKVTVEYYYT